MTKHRYGDPIPTLSVLVSPATPSGTENSDNSGIDSGHQESINSSSQNLQNEEPVNHYREDFQPAGTAPLGHPAVENGTSNKLLIEAKVTSAESSERNERLPCGEPSKHYYPHGLETRQETGLKRTSITYTPDSKAVVESRHAVDGSEPTCIEHSEIHVRSLITTNCYDCDPETTLESGHRRSGQQKEIDESARVDELPILEEVDIKEPYYNDEQSVPQRVLGTAELETTLPRIICFVNKHPPSNNSSPTRETSAIREPRAIERALTGSPTGPFFTKTSDLNAIFPPTPWTLSSWRYPSYIRRAKRTLPEPWDTPNVDLPLVNPTPCIDPIHCDKERDDLHKEYYEYCGYGAYTGYMFRPDSNHGSDFEEEEEGVLGAADLIREDDPVSDDTFSLPQSPLSDIEAPSSYHGFFFNGIEACFTESALTPPDRLLEWLEGVPVPQLDYLQLREVEGSSSEITRPKVRYQEGRRREDQQDKIKGQYGDESEGQVAVDRGEGVGKRSGKKTVVNRALITIDYEHLMEDEMNALTCQGCQDRTNNMCLDCNRCHASCCIHQVTLDMLQEVRRARLAAENVAGLTKMRSPTDDRINDGKSSSQKQLQNKSPWGEEQKVETKQSWAWYNLSL
ncbi:hypothetical protein EMPS_03708 [Entomortierella parvispora]|uniref:Uncharacterized protein n=1 Tax=Entomortierella parvispora TaxID=205924 RepID=A0A9P3H7B0_9FUNG|nr:hypothetical protein EMPS_03708 [Entomortierella parvispora]